MKKKLLSFIVIFSLFLAFFSFPVYAIDERIEAGNIDFFETSEVITVRNAVELYFKQRELILTGQDGDVSSIIPWHQLDECNHHTQLCSKGISRIAYSITIQEISFEAICVQVNIIETVAYTLDNSTNTVEIEHEVFLGNNNQYIVVEDRYYDHISGFTSCSYVQPSSTNMQAVGDGSSLCVINIAKSEIGYTEIQNQYSEPNNGYTKYGDWYGTGCAYNDWCAYFIAWCAYYADVPTDVIPKKFNVSGYVNFYKGTSGYYSSSSQGGSTTPKAGDILFMDTDLDGKVNHVGFVSAVNGNTLTVIDGNYSNKVDTRTYSLTSAVLYGYGRPSYASDGHIVAITWETNTTMHWRVCENCNAIHNRGAHNMFVDPFSGTTYCTVCNYGRGAVINRIKNKPIVLDS